MTKLKGTLPAWIIASKRRMENQFLKFLTLTRISGRHKRTSYAFINTVENQICIPIIPARKNQRYPPFIDELVYKERHLIERFFDYIKHRRVFSRPDKTTLAFTAFLHSVSTFIWLRWKCSQNPLP